MINDICCARYETKKKTPTNQTASTKHRRKENQKENNPQHKHHNICMNVELNVNLKEKQKFSIKQHIHHRKHAKLKAYKEIAKNSIEIAGLVYAVKRNPEIIIISPRTEKCMNIVSI